MRCPSCNRLVESGQCPCGAVLRPRHRWAWLQLPTAAAFGLVWATTVYLGGRDIQDFSGWSLTLLAVICVSQLHLLPSSAFHDSERRWMLPAAVFAGWILGTAALAVFPATQAEFVSRPLPDKPLTCRGLRPGITQKEASGVEGLEIEYQDGIAVHIRGDRLEQAGKVVAAVGDPKLRIAQVFQPSDPQSVNLEYDHGGVTVRFDTHRGKITAIHLFRRAR
ncbi:MAG: hypothetical protein HY319_10090 [Armatimonadetes bacterium]|nr:hypothetical protein [Armatimonadota bacterium]